MKASIWELDHSRTAEQMLSIKMLTERQRTHLRTCLTDQCEVGQLSQALAFVQDALPLVVDGIGTIAGLAAQLDVTAFQQFAIHPAPRLGRFNWKHTCESDTINTDAVVPPGNFLDVRVHESVNDLNTKQISGFIHHHL